MGRNLVRWNHFRNNLEILWHPICNRLYLQQCQDINQFGCTFAATLLHVWQSRSPWFSWIHFALFSTRRLPTRRMIVKYTQAHLPLFESLSVSTYKFHSSFSVVFCVLFCVLFIPVAGLSFLFGAFFVYTYVSKFIAGVPSFRELDSHPITAHYLYAFLNFGES